MKPGPEFPTSESLEREAFLENLMEGTWLGAPIRFIEMIDWFGAVWTHDYGDPEPLANMIREGSEIPSEFSAVVADIVAGRRKPNRKGEAKLSVTGRERFVLALVAYVLLKVAERERTKGEFPGTEQLGYAGMADRYKLEPAEAKKLASRVRRESLQVVAEEHGVKPATLESWGWDLGKRIKNWPNI